jgi:hypothetical protein
MMPMLARFFAANQRIAGRETEQTTPYPNCASQPTHRRGAICTKPAGGYQTEDGASRCFLLFFAKLSAIDIAFSAEILDGRRSGERKNSEKARCSAAVFRFLRPETAATLRLRQN